MIGRILKKINTIHSRMYLSISLKHFKSVGSGIYIGKDYVFVHPEYITIGDKFSAEKNLKLQTWYEYNGKKTGYVPEIIIGNNVSIMSNCQISCMNKIVIGDGVLIGDNVFITDNFHGAGEIEEMIIPPKERELYTKGAVVIEDNVWIGRNVCVMPGVVIGKGAIVGANAVVTRDIPEYSVVAGVPAAIIK